MEARLLEDKLARIRQLLDSFTDCRSARLLDLQSLIGTLQFACRVVVPGRTFLQCIINLTRWLKKSLSPYPIEQGIFQGYSNVEGISLSMERVIFLDSWVTSSPDLQLCTDAASTIGFWGFFNGKWLQGRWPPHLLINKTKGISIDWQELFLIVLACALWYPHFSGKRLQFWCDNHSIVAIINSGHSKAPRVMDLVRFLVLISMKHNFLVRAHRVPGINSEIADALSRFQVQRFRDLAPGADQNPCTIPPSFMKDDVVKYANWTLLWNTNCTYTSGEKRFIQFCFVHRLASPTVDILPASERTLIYFASYLGRTVRHGTIKTYLADIRNLYIISGYKDPLRERLLLKKILRGILCY